jgi:hypothetical protein
MGFMLSDMDYRLLGNTKRDALWDSLPLKAGVEPPAPVAAAAAFVTTEEPLVAVTPPAPVKLTDVDPSAPAPLPPSPVDEVIVELADEAPFMPVPADEAIVELAEEAPSTPSAPAEAIPAALSGSGTAMRARARKLPPSAEELSARRQKLLESLGRFLASL